ncbi:MAG: DUF1844 domain-containing protein [Myxococcaceae bacterium]
MTREARGETFVMKDTPGNEQPVEFTTFLLGLASTALIHMGESPNPETSRSERNLPLARQSLDLLSLLKDKTRGNLTREEERVFDELLADLRLRYVEASKR